MIFVFPDLVDSILRGKQLAAPLRWFYDTNARIHIRYRCRTVMLIRDQCVRFQVGTGTEIFARGSVSAAHIRR